MYKIMIRYNESHGLWQSYGSETVTTSTTGESTSVYTEFETDDENVLKEELVKLDAKYGHENIMACDVVDVIYNVDIAAPSDDGEQSP